MRFDLFEEILRLRREAVPAALATVIRAQGSTPAKVPTRMIVRMDGGTAGTVGGGCVEADVIRAARDVIDTGKPRTLQFRLAGEEAERTGIACGGIVEIMVESLEDPSVIIVGAGHVGQAVARLASTVGLAVTVIDDRPDFANEARFPNVQGIAVAPLNDLAGAVTVGRLSSVLIMTRGHAEDLEVLRWALTTPARHIGVLGSRSKRKKFIQQLESEGHEPEALQAVSMPVGLDIGAESVEEIAISIVGELIARRRKVDPSMPDSISPEPRLLAALNRILEGLPEAGPTLAGILEFCGHTLEELFPKLLLSFAFAREDPTRLVIGTVPPEPGPLKEGQELLAGTHPDYRRVAAHDPVLLRGGATASSPVAAALAASGWASVLLVPLRAQGALMGTWNLATRVPDGFTPQEVGVLRSLGDAVALAASRAHLQAHLESQRQQLVESEKLAAVGRLVAGVAHELGGPLQAIISLGEVLGRDPDRGDRKEAANRILRSALRCRGMVQDLLTYARKQPYRLHAVRVSDAVMDALELDRYSDVGEIQIQIDGEENATVLADSQRLCQVFLNLISNARHATVEDGQPGLVRVHVTQVPAESSRLPLPGGTPVVQVAVEDRGCGVPDEIRDKIFEPFVTTKPPGSGTGLGLSVSRSLVLDMGGELYLDARYEPGARFVVELPATTQDATEETAEPELAGEETTDGYSLLIIDDDRELLETYEVILAVDHHRVISCDRGRKALELLREQDFDAILCDIRLPDVPGPAFLEELREMRPEMVSRVIFATGDVVNDATRAFLASVPNQALFKPFQIEDLHAALRTVVRGNVRS